MSLWDKTTDMSKGEWKDTCVRTMNGTNLTPEDLSHVADVSRIVGDSEQGVPETHAEKQSKHARNVHRNGGETKSATSTTPKKEREAQQRPAHSPQLD